MNMINELINRRTPEIADRFVIDLTESENETWGYEAQGDKVSLTGSSVLCLCVAYKRFLFDCCGGYFTSDHSVAYKEFILPAEGKNGVITRKYRMCLTHQFFSCAACCWDWDRWEKEIDYMAMNGVNMPLCLVGTQAVWFKTLLDMGMEEKFALSDMSGPSYWGWQTDCCFDAFLPQIRRSTVEKTVQLGRQIADRERELGMKPVMHAWSGYVSRVYIHAKLRARMTKTDPYFRFSPQFFISYKDPRFTRIATLFLKNQNLLLGEAEYYFADPFSSHEPPKDKKEFFAGYGTVMLRAITSANEKAKWIVRPSTAVKPLLKAVDSSRIIVITDKPEDYEDVETVRPVSFNGCDVTALHGDIHALAETDPDESVGVFSDGEVSNEFFRFAAMSTLTGQADFKELSENYVKNRWQTSSEKAMQAMEILSDTVWKKGSPSREYGSLICQRPSFSTDHTSLGDAGTVPDYNNDRLFEAVKLMLDCGGSGREFELDLCDILRQALVNRAGDHCKKANEAYLQKDVEAFEKNSNAFLSEAEALNRLMLTKKEFSLPYHIGAVRELGSDDNEKQNFEINLLAQLTIFGPMREPLLYDICHKEWGDMIGTYYAARWHAWFETLALTFKKNRLRPGRLNSYGMEEYNGTVFGQKLAQVEQDWISRYDPAFDSMEKENTLDVAREILAQG